MAESQTQQRVARLRTTARVFASIALGGGAITLFGWAFEEEGTSTSLFADLRQMKANTALGLVMAGASLWLSTTRNGYVRAAAIFAGFAGTIGFVTLMQDITGWNAGIDEFLFENPTAEGSPGRMAPTTAFCFLAFGISALCAQRANRLRLAHTLALVSALVTLVALIGHLYNVEALYSIGTLRTMASHTALFHLLLAVGLLFAYPSGGLMTSIVSDTLGGSMARRLLPIAIVLPIVAGWLRLKGESAGLYGLGFGVALMAVSSIVAVAAMIWWSATSLGRMEAERRRSEEAFSAHLRDILDTALDASVSIDATSRITYWNRRAEEIFGWSQSDAIGQDLSMIIMPDRYREAHRRGLRHFLATGEGPILGRRIEITALRRDGTEFPVELTVSALKDSGQPAFNAFIADISERKRAEEELRVGQEHTTSLLRISHRLERASTFTDVLQAALEEITRQMGFRSVWAFLLAEDGETASLITIEGEIADTVRRSLPTLIVKGDRFLEAIFAATEPVVVEDARVDPRTDKAIVERLQNRTILNAPLLLSDKRIGAVGTGSFGDEGVRVPTKRQVDYFAAMASHIAAAFDRIRLLDERARVNEELERRVARRTAQLATANKELEAFSYSVSHDLRAPLRHVDAFSRILLEEHAANLDETGQKYIGIIRAGAQRMGRMVDDLLHLSRIERQKLALRETDLNTVVQEVLRDVEDDLAGRSIEWRVGELPVAACDPGLIKLAFTNLLSNAIKYTKHRPTAIIEVGYEAEPSPGVIYVRDNGAGFDQRYADKLFGVFQRLHRSEDFEGTGIGLATVQRIVNKHGGRIWAQGAVEKGATFFITLPDMRRAHERLADARVRETP